VAVDRRSVLGALVVLPLGACGAGPPPAAGQAPARMLAPAEFAAAMGDRFVVNVHVPDEGSLAGTDVAIPFDRVAERAAELPVDRAVPLAVYCMTGRMSAAAAGTLAGLGYTDVVDLAGGMRAWRADGRPIQAP
jgi:phage shock protein E